MALTTQEVKHVAELARLELTSTEIESLRKELSAILEYAAILDTLDTGAIPPTASVLPICNVMRADEVEPSMSQDEALANAPCVDQEHFSVKAILE